MRATILAAVALGLAVSAPAVRADPPPRPGDLLDAAVSEDGRLVLVREKRTAVATESERGLAVEIGGTALPDLPWSFFPENAYVSGVRAAANRSIVVLSLALHESTRNTYRFAVYRDKAWRLSVPIFEDAAPLWNPLHARTSETGGLELTFRRAVPRSSTGFDHPAVEEVLYVDRDADPAKAGDEAATMRWSLVPSADAKWKPDARGGPVVRIDLLDGGLILEGEQLGRLVDAPEEERARTLAALKTRLIARAAPAGKDPDTGASRLLVKVRGDRTAKWKLVQDIMKVCADPEVRIYKLRFDVIAARSVERVVALSVEGRTDVASGLLHVADWGDEVGTVRSDAEHRAGDLDAVSRRIAGQPPTKLAAPVRIEYSNEGEHRVEPRDVADLAARLVLAGFEDVQIRTKAALERDRDRR